MGHAIASLEGYARRVAGQTVLRVDAEIAHTLLQLASLNRDSEKRNRRIARASEAIANCDRLLAGLDPKTFEYFEIACARNRLSLLLEELKTPVESDQAITHAW